MARRSICAWTSLGLVLLASAAMAAESLTPLQQARAMHQAYSKTSFDKGGALSRYVWLNLPAFVHTAPVITRGPVRPQPLAPRRDVLEVPVTLRDLLDMASGIEVYEAVPDAYINPEQPHYRFEEALGIVPRVNPEQAVEAVLAGFPAAEPAGQSYRYKSADTYVLGTVIENVTGKPYWQVLSERIWTPMGAAADALLWIDHDGRPLVAGGLYARLQDLARFGLAFTPSGRSGGNLQVVSEALLADLTAGARPALYTAGEGAAIRAEFAADPPSHASWQWDMIWPDGDAFKGGYSGQGLFVSPRRDMVMAWYGTHDPSAEPGELHLASVARQLSRSGLFPEPASGGD